jgi:predicted exporter
MNAQARPPHAPRTARLAARLPVLLWLAAMALCALLVARARFVADLSAFLPHAPTARQQMLIEQLQDGVVTRLVLMGIEGGDEAARARLSREFAARLREGPWYVGVQNGDRAVEERDRALVFGNRYLLAASSSAGVFTEAGMHEAIGRMIGELAGGAGMALRAIMPRDPTGASLEILEALSAGEAPRSIEGAWASRDGRRAVLLAQLRASGSDLDAQARALADTRAMFAQCLARVGTPPPAEGKGTGAVAPMRLVLAGTSELALESRATIEGDAARFAAAGFAFVVLLLLAVYRSARLLGIGMVPVLTGAMCGVAAVSLAFPEVHSLTLAFGTTLIGEAVDYSIYYFLQRSGNPADGSAVDGSVGDGGAVDFWRTIRLGVLTSIAGFAALLFSGFPGLAQLGVYSISGLVAAALATRFVLPLLTPASLAVRDLARAGRGLDRALEVAGRLRWIVLLVPLAAAALIAARHGEVWNRDLGAMNPVSAAQQRLDFDLRADMAAQDMRYLVAFGAPDAQAALQEAERIGATLQGLAAEGVIGGFSSPATVLPSLAAQRARQAAMPAPAEARRRLALALAGLPAKPGAFAGFLEDLERTRTRAPLVRADLDGTSLALLADSLLVHRAADWLVLMPLRPPGGPEDTIDLARVTPALGGAATIDLLGEATSLFTTYLAEASRLALAGCGVILVLLLASLRSVPRTLRVAAPLACAVLCTVAALLLVGTKLTILHLVGLLLVVAVGSNYALFFVREDRAAAQGSDGVAAAVRQRTQVSVLVANIATVCSFGLLGFSRVPVLSYIGTTVGLGALLAFVFSALLARAPAAPARDAHAP